MTALVPFLPIFHAYNRSNDRATLFQCPRHYRYFLSKLRITMLETAHILGYCIMPNHFHILFTPKHELCIPLRLDGKPLPCMPTREVGESFRRLLMGFSKGYNHELVLTGSRFRQRTRCKYHIGSLHHGLNYVHNNPVAAKLVDHPGEWSYSSYFEYTDFLNEDEKLCNTVLGKQLCEEVLHW